MTDWEYSGNIKIKRAEKHIHDLEVEIDAFEKRSPYGVWTDNDQETGTVIFRVSQVYYCPNKGIQPTSACGLAPADRQLSAAVQWNIG